MKSYTDIEQSKRLEEILPLESADMCWEVIYASPKDDIIEYANNPIIGYIKHCLPAWSLAALLDILPYPYIEQNYKGKWTCRVEHGNTTYLWEDFNPINACVAMIEKLHEQNLL